jgi:hypothetical protein
MGRKHEPDGSVCSLRSTTGETFWEMVKRVSHGGFRVLRSNQARVKAADTRPFPQRCGRGATCRRPLLMRDLSRASLTGF